MNLDKIKIKFLFIFLCLGSNSLFALEKKATSDFKGENLKKLYCSPKENWPKVDMPENAKFNEIGSITAIRDEAKSYAQLEKKKVELGKQLFFDPRLSHSNQIACASCHDPQLGWADGKRMAFGHDRQMGSRNTMSLFNVSHFKPLFWDGRAANLTQQALMPVQDLKEMHSTLTESLQKLNNIEGYQKQFSEVYSLKKGEDITANQLADTLASFQKTITSRKTRFDKFIDGDCNQLNEQEVVGMHLFRTKANCIRCHNGPLFTDNQFHHTGLGYIQRNRFEDLGRYKVTGNKIDIAKFRTPSLRELKHTGPYMHNGLFTTMSGILNMYNAGMRKSLKPYEPPLSPLIEPLNLTKQELQDLEAFIMALSSRTSPFVEPPKLPDK